MKTVVTICLLTLLMFTQTPVGQIFRLPLLIEHFTKHQKQENISFFKFLQEHYNPNHNDDDLPEDEQLPFKNIPIFNIGYAIVPVAIKTQLFISLLVDKKVIISDAYAPQQHLARIFHPPKV